MRQAIDELGNRLSEPQRRDAQAELESLVQAKRDAVRSVTVPRLGDVTVDPETIFILMPFTRDLEPIYEIITRAADEVGLRSFRADSILAVGSIIDQIYESIAKSGLIVADLTGRNQNVMYELGLANAMGKKTLLLSQNIKDVPFDVRQQRVFTYKLSDSSLDKLRRQLVGAFQEYRHERDA
jgi:hypothetical protein